ncbi:glycosyltransferase family 1 protein [Georgenia sp. Z1491]|uniref:glycosyltransferase family 1 protein n=1 Tax=Georgenia sp. Z1491 TaxID=3416707 RepID=UPI003CEBF979
MTQPTRMLIISFSKIATDPRVLKQVSYFADRYEVTTCGFGPAPEGVAEHIELPLTHTNKLDGRLITSRIYRLALWAQRGMRKARELLKGREFDIALANDFEAVPVALGTRPRFGVHADMHEYFPRWREEQDAWRRRIGPYYLSLCKRYLPRCRSLSTVSGGLAREYQRITGMDVEVVTNATPYYDLEPGTVGERIRLVHSGVSLRRRHLELTIEAAGRASDVVELDMYLMKSDPTHLAELEELAAATSNVRILDPVPYAELVETLNRYDAGIFVVPPVTFNLEWTLPNKFFDFVQARLGIVTGPSPEMAELTRTHGLGVVTGGFAVDDIEATLAGLDRDEVARFKAASHAVAQDLAAEAEVEKWGAAIEKLLAG